MNGQKPMSLTARLETDPELVSSPWPAEPAALSRPPWLSSPASPALHQSASKAQTVSKKVLARYPSCGVPTSVALAPSPNAPSAEAPHANASHANAFATYNRVHGPPSTQTKLLLLVKHRAWHLRAKAFLCVQVLVPSIQGCIACEWWYQAHTGTLRASVSTKHTQVQYVQVVVPSTQGCIACEWWYQAHTGTLRASVSTKHTRVHCVRVVVPSTHRYIACKCYY